MDTIFMNSENSKTSEPHVLILKLTYKLRIGEKIIALSNLSIYQKQKAHTIINLKYLHQHGMINGMMDRILDQIFRIILSTF